MFSMLAASFGDRLHADLLVGWNFNDIDASSRFLLSDVGSGRLDFERVAGEHDVFAGTSINAFGDLAAGSALGFRGPAAETGAIVLDWGTTPGIGGAAGDLRCSFAARRSPTGSDRIEAEIWSDGDWKSLASMSIATTWSTSVFDLDEHDVTSTGLRLRFTLAGASNPQGTIRLDNLRIDAVPVPSPATLAAMIPAVPGVRSRRRR